MLFSITGFIFLNNIFLQMAVEEFFFFFFKSANCDMMLFETVGSGQRLASIAHTPPVSVDFKNSFVITNSKK